MQTQILFGFLWLPEGDGTKSLWYGITGGRAGLGSLQRAPPGVKPDSPIADYANLLGVALPPPQPPMVEPRNSPYTRWPPEPSYWSISRKKRMAGPEAGWRAWT
jgi:hypothetical protein